MRFDCCETPEERVPRLQKIAEQYVDWHDYFCWVPVRVGPHDCRWFEVIERRSPLFWIGKYSGNIYYQWEYRAKEAR